MDLRQKIEEITAPFIAKIGAFVTDIQIIHEKQKHNIQLFIDTDTGITIEQCAEVSRQLSKEVELSQIITGPYILQVSSPGLKKPLKLLRQYKKNTGRLFKVRFHKDNGVVELIARLTSIEGDILKFSTKTDELYSIPFNEIVESIEVLPW